MDSLTFKLMEQYDYENLFFCQEKSVGLKAIIAIHDTTLGPAAGGTRMWPYATEEDAVGDALRLARAMTYKCAAAGMNFGGGKCVVIADPKRDKTEALLRTLGRFINRLGGLFVTGVDVGTTVRDMEIMRMESPYIVTVSEALGGPGDTAQTTALGVVQGIRACLKAIYGSPELQGRSVAVQGVGGVGKDVVERLVKAGAIVTIADVDQEKVASVAAAHGVRVVPPDEIAQQAVDVYCPCALGAVLNDRSIPELHCKIVCGSANNQLAEERHGDMLEQHGILYAPDYVVNAGGVLAGIDSFNPGGFKRLRAEETIARIYETVEKLIALARAQHIPTYRAADVLAEERIAMVRQVKSLASGAEKK
ncbi:Glu/Leu/Phe/Val dehydrogenase [Ktedonosporobacter rubrisoli]|uniref:Glu/Leu/Phe/Val dehydrogenase n=1 Tax=Ktedonosporobacter rubrisoli TaxID=2509675 RepID=A0A4P6K373_KTERU|nr:Glu/Leu/Phe/Val dehydrogenase dimerization domain-containing protein [Ktedonosporobacter rubrisoli]QBD82698.1 Glu/Leu/Phe/Val dehydrogenase [Ktedonosporobacter rubrisoli]